MRPAFVCLALLMSGCFPDTDFVTVSAETRPNAFQEPLDQVWSKDVDEMLARAEPLVLHEAGTGTQLDSPLELHSVTTGSGATRTPVARIAHSSGGPALQAWNGESWAAGDAATYDFVAGQAARENGATVQRMGDRLPLLAVRGSEVTYFGWYAPSSAEYRVVSMSMPLDTVLPDRAGYRMLFDVDPGRAWASHCLWLLPWETSAVDYDRDAFQVCFQLPYTHEEVSAEARGQLYAKARRVKLKRSWWPFN